MTARFAHDPALRARFPALRMATLIANGLDRLDPTVLDPAPFAARARVRLADAPEGEWTEIRAWRAAYGAMGLKPTQVRCASESLLRRLRLDGALPQVAPVVDFCNAVSAAFGIPLAVFDLDCIAGDLRVTFAAGDEPFATFGGTEERPAPGEVIFRDGAGVAHARRWAHRQGVAAAVSAATRRVLMVAEAMHDGAEADLAAMTEALAAGVAEAGGMVRFAAAWEGSG